MNEISAPWLNNQPGRGLFGLGVCFILAMAVTSAFAEMGDFLGLMMVWAVACVSPLAVIGLMWGGTWPADKLENPWRGLALTAMVFLLGTIALFWSMQFVGAGQITPILQHYLIMTVVVTLWLIIAFDAWPFKGKMSLGAAGFCVLIATYLIDMAIFRLWDFHGAAPYSFGQTPLAGIAPTGPFHPDSAVTFGVMTVLFLFVFVVMDMWPLTKFPSLCKQPLMGIIILTVSIGLSVAAWGVMRWSMDMLPYEILIKFPIVGLFGTFIILPMFQTWPGRNWAQPAKGFINLICIIILAIVMFFAVKALGEMFTGVQFGNTPIPAGGSYPESYLWMATFMLGLVFPFMFNYGPFFDFWPLKPTPPPPAEASESEVVSETI